MAKASFFSLAALLGLSLSSQAQKPFKLQGTYVEGCACPVACSCDLKGMMASGCQVIGAFVIRKGQYGDADLSGAEVAYVAGSGYVTLFYHVKNEAQTKPLSDLATAYFSSFGKVESITPASIEVTGTNGNYTLTVDGGAIAKVDTAPILGGDGKTAVVYSNYPDPFIPKIMQGKTVSGASKVEGHPFELKDSNAFFNPNWSTAGKI